MSPGSAASKLISKSSSIGGRAKEPFMSALKYLRPEKAETPSLGSMRLTCNKFVLDRHRIQEHVIAAPLGRTDRRGSSGRWPQRVRPGRSVHGSQRVPETGITNRARNRDKRSVERCELSGRA